MIDVAFGVINEVREIFSNTEQMLFTNKSHKILLTRSFKGLL